MVSTDGSVVPLAMFDCHLALQYLLLLFFSSFSVLLLLGKVAADRTEDVNICSGTDLIALLLVEIPNHE